MREYLVKRIKVLGPGIIFASLCIGETHLALLTYTGALYGYTLLWMVLMVHIFYYPNYEYGPRYAVATGQTLIDGYAKIKIGRVLLKVLTLFMFVTPPLIMSSVLGLSSSVLFTAIPIFSFRVWCVILFGLTVGIVLGGKYKGIEVLSKFLVFIIILTAILAFAVSPPQLGKFAGGFIPGIPAVAGVWIVIVAILRVPTDPASSIFMSEWAQKKREEWLSSEEESGKQALLVALKKSLFDIRVGMTLSCLVGIIFMSIGATVLKPLGVVPEGVEVSLKLSEIFTQSLGNWIFPVSMVALFAAFWGGYLAVMDGVKRLFRNLIQQVFKTDDKKAEQWSTAYMILVALSGLLMATLFQRPMVMVLIAVSMGLINYPLIFGLNIYCVTRQIDKAFQPSKLNLIIAFLGFALGVGGLVLLILVRILKVFS